MTLTSEELGLWDQEPGFWASGCYEARDPECSQLPVAGPGSFYTVWHLLYWVFCSWCWWPHMSSWSSLSTPCSFVPTNTLKVSVGSRHRHVLVSAPWPLAKHRLTMPYSLEESHRCVVCVLACCPRGDPGSCHPGPGCPTHPPRPAFYSPARPPALLPHLSK